MSVETADLRTIKTIVSILRKFPPIQNKRLYEYHRRGKSFFYGLKSSDFNKFTDLENGERLFNYWRDKLVESRFLLKIFPDKQKGSPYAITPFGIAFLLQNLHPDEINWDTEISNCQKVIFHFHKGDSSKLNGEYTYNTFVKSCRMINFEGYGIVLQTVLGDDIEVDLNLDIAVKNKIKPKDPLQDKQDFEDVAYHILGNMCWLQLHNRLFQIKAHSYFSKFDDSHFKFVDIDKEIANFGKTFGDKVVLKFLSEESQRVVEILTQ